VGVQRDRKQNRKTRGRGKKGGNSPLVIAQTVGCWEGGRTQNPFGQRVLVHFDPGTEGRAISRDI